MNLPTAILTISYLILRTIASETGDAALRGFEQSDSEDAELAHSMQVRAHIPRFVGKRTLGDDDESMLLKQQQENIEQENLQNILMYLLKNYEDNSDETQRLSEDLSTQSDEDPNSDTATFERYAKWAPKFVGKRRSPMFVGRRRAPLFVGKRYAPRFVGKRGAPMFVGRSGSPMFVGRRDSPMFIGRREQARPADTSYYVGGKRSVIASSELMHPENSARLNSVNFDENKLNNKRERERYVFPQEMHLSDGTPVYSDYSKRFVVPEFVGKRERLSSAMQNIFAEKRFDTPFFVGRRSADFESIKEFNPGFSFTAQEPAMHSEYAGNLIKNVNSKT